MVGNVFERKILEIDAISVVTTNICIYIHYTYIAGLKVASDILCGGNEYNVLDYIQIILIISSNRIELFVSYAIYSKRSNKQITL